MPNSNLKKKIVAMVGYEINDAPILAKVDLGIVIAIWSGIFGWLSMLGGLAIAMSSVTVVGNSSYLEIQIKVL